MLLCIKKALHNFNEIEPFSGVLKEQKYKQQYADGKLPTCCRIIHPRMSIDIEKQEV